MLKETAGSIWMARGDVEGNAVDNRTNMIRIIPVSRQGLSLPCADQRHAGKVLYPTLVLVQRPRLRRPFAFSSGCALGGSFAVKTRP